MNPAGAPVRRRPGGWFGAVMWTLGGLLLAFIVLPIVRLAAASPVGSLRPPPPPPRSATPRC